ncbi:MAG: recombinase family protein, partial [Lachnospiraceae bacterium]|nr:recombinase family protein [Lachnospiraceae bacterium]
MINPNKTKEASVREKQSTTVTTPSIGVYGKNGDISDFGISVEEMIRRCRESGHTVWAYARVSTLAQDLRRQIDDFLKLGVKKKNIIQDKATGTNFERHGFKKLLNLVKEGDIILFTELDRFGRDFLANVNFAIQITIEKKVGIGFIANPELNRMGRQSEFHTLISMMMFLVHAYSSFDEHEKILRRTSQGRKVKAKAGAAFGRKPSDITDEFRKRENDILSGRVSRTMARKELGVNYRTLKKWIRYARKQRLKREVEEKASVLSQKAAAWLKEMLGAGAAVAMETVLEVKGLVEEFIASMENLAEALSVWRRVPVVDEDGTIIRPKTYQRKETELDNEVRSLEADIRGLNLFADGLIKALESGRTGVPAYSHRMDGTPPGALFPDGSESGAACDIKGADKGNAAIADSNEKGGHCGFNRDGIAVASGTDCNEKNGYGLGSAAMQGITNAPESKPSRRLNAK